MIGNKLSHYKVLEKLGAVGMGEVYLAEWADLQEWVSVNLTEK